MGRWASAAAAVVSVVSISPHSSCSCVFKSVSRSKVDRHLPHVYSFSPVCEIVCLLRLDAFGNVLSHIWHSNGRIRWWMLLLCFSKLEFDVNDFSQESQEYGLSPVCVSWWDLRLYASLKRFSQVSQAKSLIPRWIVCLCIFKLDNWTNAFPQTSQT